MFKNKKAEYLVIVESPFAGWYEIYQGFYKDVFSEAGNPIAFVGDITNNIFYGRLCLRNALENGESPLASHLLLTQPGILDDRNIYERIYGINAGLLWGPKADYTVVYIDLGISSGMIEGIKRARKEERPVVFRSLFGEISKRLLKGIEMAIEKGRSVPYMRYN